MVWKSILQGAIFSGILIGLVCYLYITLYNKKPKEGFADLTQVAFCNDSANALSNICTKPDVPLIGPETSQETAVFDTYEANNLYDLPKYVQTTQKPYDTSIQFSSTDYSQGLPWDIDNIQQDTNAVLWGFVFPICSRDLFAVNAHRMTFGSINNFEYDLSAKVFTYKIPIFNNIEVSGSDIGLFKAAEFITNFAMGTVIELAVDKLVFDPISHAFENLVIDGAIPFLGKFCRGLAIGNFRMEMYHEFLAAGCSESEARLFAFEEGEKYDQILEGKGEKYEQIVKEYKSTLNAKKAAEFDTLHPSEMREALKTHIKTNAITPEMKAVGKTKFFQETAEWFASWFNRTSTRLTKAGSVRLLTKLASETGEIAGDIAKDIKDIVAGAEGARAAEVARVTAAEAAAKGEVVAVKMGERAVPITTHAIEAGARAVGTAIVGSITTRISTQLGMKLTEYLGQAVLVMGTFGLLGPAGWGIFWFMLAWTILMVIIIPVIMNEYIPPDGVCPTDCPYNLMESAIEQLGSSTSWEIITNIPIIGEALGAFGPYLCSSLDGSKTVPKKYYESPLYYYDSTLSLFASTTKPMVPDTDPAYGDRRKYYEIVGYDFEAINSGNLTLTGYLNTLTSSVDLRKHTKKDPPVWVDFSHATMLNKMAEFYYKTSRRLPYTNYDGTLSFEYITKIYGVAASSQYSCDIQCEITIDTIYPFTGVLKSRNISPPDPLGNTYHDRRFYFYSDTADVMFGQTIHGNVIDYYFQVPGSSSKFNMANRPIRDSGVYTRGCDWDLLMDDNMARYHITGCTCVNGTALCATDSPSAGYVGDTIVSVGDPGSDYYKPTLSVQLDAASQLPNDTSCDFTRARTTYSKVNSIPMSTSKKTTGIPHPNEAILYNGSLFGKIPSMRLTLALSPTGSLTFTELQGAPIPFQKQVSGVYDENGTPTNDAAHPPAIGNSVYILDNENGLSFNATITSYVAGASHDTYIDATLGLSTFRNIKGDFLTNGEATTLTNCVILYASKWPATTKIWTERPPIPISDYQHSRSILQGIITGTIAQAPGMGLEYQFVGGAFTTGLDMAGITNMIACSYSDIQKQSGTFVVNGIIMTNQIANNGSQCYTQRGPTIDYSPGYSPKFDRSRGLILKQDDCINRYNIRVAVKTYTDKYTDKIIKRIYHIRGMPDRNMCVYDVEQNGYDRSNLQEYDIDNKNISFGIVYSNNNETRTFVPTAEINMSPPPIASTPPVADNLNSLYPTYVNGSVTDTLERDECNEKKTKYSCGSYKIMKRLFDQFNGKYDNSPAIYPNLIHTDMIGSCSLSGPPYGLQATNVTISTNTGTSLIDVSKNQMLIFKEIVAVGAPTSFQYTFEGMVESVSPLKISNVYSITPYIEYISFQEYKSITTPISFDMTKSVIQFTIYNNTWLIEGANINITFVESNKTFNVSVVSYINNVLSVKPVTNISGLGTQQVTNMIIRLNEITGDNLYDPSHSSSINLKFTNPKWISPGMSVNVTCIAESRIITYTASVNATAMNEKTLSLSGFSNIVDIAATWLKAGANVTISDPSKSPSTIYTGSIAAITGSTITLSGPITPYTIPIIVTISSGSNSIQYSATIANNILTNTFVASYIVTLNDTWVRKFNIYTIKAYSNTDIAYGDVCTYMVDITASTFNNENATMETLTTTPDIPITFFLAATDYTNDTSLCMYNLSSDSFPTAMFFPQIPRPGRFIELPSPIPVPNTKFTRSGCPPMDCSGIDIVSTLVDQYNTTNPYAKILKVIRAYTPLMGSGQPTCEYQVEMSRKIPGTSRDHITKKETIRFMLTPDASSPCLYKYVGIPGENSGLILNAYSADPTSSVPDSFQLSPIYVWPVSIIDRYRHYVNQAISMYQSMMPSWSDILKTTSTDAESKMTAIFYDVYTNKTLGGCPDKNCRDDDTLLKICRQYNYDNYPTYFGTTEQYGYVQRNILEVRRGGLGGNISQCQIELIEQEDFYEDYTLKPVNTDDPTQAKFNTKFFLRQYQFNVSISNCVVSPIALTKQQILTNYMDVSSNPFGIQSDLSIVSPKYSVQIADTMFNMSEFYSLGFLAQIKAKYDAIYVNHTPDKKNTLVSFVNAFIVSPTICEYQVKIIRQMYSDDYGIWYTMPENPAGAGASEYVDSYIVVKTDNYNTGRTISSNNGLTESILMDINFALESGAYVPRRAGQVVALPYMFYADLTDPKTRVVGFTGSRASISVKIPNADPTMGYTA